MPLKLVPRECQIIDTAYLYMNDEKVFCGAKFAAGFYF
jgi:hypothetical protein